MPFNVTETPYHGEILESTISTATENISIISPIKCVFPFGNINLERLFIGVCTIILGVLYLCVGYRLLKLLFYVTGFLLLGIVIFILLWFNAGLSLSISLVVASLAGSLLSVLSGCVVYCGYFTIGSAFGIQLGLFAIFILDQLSLIIRYWLILCLIGVPMLVLGLFTLMFRKSLCIISTAMCGSTLLIFSLDCFIQKYLLSQSLWNILTSIVPSKTPSKLCFQSYIIISCVPVILIFGVVFQCKVSAKNVKHQDKAHDCCSKDSAIRRGQKSTRYLCDPPSSPHQQQHSWHRMNHCSVSSGTPGPSHHHYSFVPSGTISSLKTSGSEYGTGGRRCRTIGHSHSPVDPVADKFCHLYRIRQIQGDVPSQDAFQTFQLRHSGYYGNAGSIMCSRENQA